MSVFVKFSGKSFALSNQNLQDEITLLFENLHIDSSSLVLQCNGKPFSSLKTIQQGSTINVTMPLLGGKGGFGAKLKNQGGKKIRPNDNRFSRDAQGRRIQYQMAQKQYAEFVKKKMQEDEKVQRQRQQFKVMQQTMKEGQSFMKLDKKYNQEVEEAQNRLAQSIKIGRQKLMEKMKLNGHTNEEQKDCQKRQYGSEQQKRQVNHSHDNPEKEEEKQEIQKLQKPIKKVKIEQLPIEQKPKAVFVSAKDKLKSLFKK